MKWVEEAKLFLAQLEKGMSYAEIAEKANVSESNVKGLVETYQNLRDIPGGTELEYSVANHVYRNAIGNNMFWMYDVEEELPILIEYVLKNKLNVKQISKIMFALLNFSATLQVVKEWNEALYNDLKTVYYPYRFNPRFFSLFKKEKALRMGKAKLARQFLSLNEYPTEESARQHASLYHGELLCAGKIIDENIVPIYDYRTTQEIDGWFVDMIPYTLEEIRKELAKKRMKP